MSNNQDFFGHFIQSWAINDGSWHDYMIQRDASNICDYFLWVDSVKWGTSTTQYCPGGYSYGYEVDVGLEHNYNAYDPDFYTNTNTDWLPKTWHDGAWQWWEYHYEWNKSEPCTQSQPKYCFNGEWQSGDPQYWSTNRPWS
jgi:hypothetical protein